jgi:dephospho-CoA kinase
MLAAMPDNTEMPRIEALVGSGRSFPSNYLIMPKRQTLHERGFREVAFSNEEVRDVLNGIVDGGIDTWVEVIKDIYKYGILEKSGKVCV